MDVSRGAITTMRWLGRGGPSTTDTEPLKRGGRLNEIARAGWSHMHTDIFRWQASRHCFRASGGGAGVGGDRALPLGKHPHSEILVAGGPPPHPERFERGGRGWPAASGRLLALSRRIGGGWWSATTHSAFKWRCGARSGTTRCLAGSRPAFSGLKVFHHCAQCHLTGGGSVCRCSGRAAAPYTYPTHRRRAHSCDVSGHHLHCRPPATLFPCSSSTTFPLRPHVPFLRLETRDPHTHPTLFATHPLL